MNAYELADELLRDNTQLTVKAAYMLRQQADRIAELEKQTNPLSDEEIIGLVKDHFIGAIKLGIVLTNDNVLEFARAIEERHGIK